jgi:lipopolysaccharide/colanic/teichoic acid biosynthesis glycosyltransferase
MGRKEVRTTMNQRESTSGHGRTNATIGPRSRADKGHRPITRHACYAIPVDLVPQPPVRSAPVWIAEGLYRVMEYVSAFGILLLTSPIMLIEAIIIRRDSPGPAMFSVDRMSQSEIVPGKALDGRPDVRLPEGNFDLDRLYYAPRTFKFTKFRTMFQDAAERWPEYYWWNYDIPKDQLQHMYYKLDDDPRITRVGKWLRTTSLDELPNFWSVIRGDVRLVGPRPETIEVATHYSPEQMVKFTVKPGITCLSKIYGRADLSMQEQVYWDLEYIRTRSLWLDLKILFLTFWGVIRRRGAF